MKDNGIDDGSRASAAAARSLFGRPVRIRLAAGVPLLERDGPTSCISRPPTTCSTRRLPARIANDFYANGPRLGELDGRRPPRLTADHGMNDKHLPGSRT